ncbi:MAG: phosphatase PAP2 family protein [Bacteroidaceae bacterium]|nr:phosphatase PAP2 family protein [Bacteroidaceae bacterium]
MKVKERTAINVAAKALSRVFRPSYYPLVGFIILLTCTYLSLLPWAMRLGLLLLVALLTLFVPFLGVEAYRRMRHLTRQELLLRNNRLVPYILHIICYGVLLHFLNSIHAPTFMGGIVVISLLVQSVCTVINLWWKISMHSAGVGAIMGALVTYAAVFNFNPVWWLCLSILVSGLVNSSRMFLRQHTLWQVLGGTVVGFVCGLIGLIL